jgi:2,3-bisphosphoglycerate-dependent phosphoglycerate mutase
MKVEKIKGAAMKFLVLLRHGESVWNSENRFTGWTDVDLSEKGKEQAHEAGILIKKEGFIFDVAFTSVLKRAIDTLNIALDECGQYWIPVIKCWRLNERHYGALQGLDKAQTAKKYGDNMVHLWRRGYYNRPPELERSDSRWPGHEIKYRDVNDAEVPISESLDDVLKRLMPFWHSDIRPSLKSGKNVLISAHGNSLRSLVKHLQNLDEEQIENVDIPTGVPLIYELNDELKPVDIYYLGDNEKIETAYR